MIIQNSDLQNSDVFQNSEKAFCPTGNVTILRRGGFCKKN